MIWRLQEHGEITLHLTACFTNIIFQKFKHVYLTVGDIGFIKNVSFTT